MKPKFIVLTGGPCGGKTSSKSILKQRLTEMGYTPIFIPETATIFLGSGIDFSKILADDNTGRFQRAIFEYQMMAEDLFKSFGDLQDNVVFICDRGLKDGEAYTQGDEFREMIAEYGLTEADILTRYAGVIHIVTAADGAVEHYNFDNSVRLESPEEAILLDRRIQDCWNGHPNLIIIPNVDLDGRQITFGEKMDWMLEEVSSLIGAPVPIESERKYLLEPVDIDSLPVTYKRIGIFQTYLTNRGQVERRVRVWTYAGEPKYFYTEKTPIKGTAVSRFNLEREISADEYIELLKQSDPNSAAVEKTRYSFVWRNQYFELDKLTEPLEMYLCEVQVSDKQPDVVIPDFLEVVRDVTDDPSYRNAGIATLALEH